MQGLSKESIIYGSMVKDFRKARTKTGRKKDSRVNPRLSNPHLSFSDYFSNTYIVVGQGRSVSDAVKEVLKIETAKHITN